MSDDHLNLEFPTLVAGNSYKLEVTLTDINDGSSINAAGYRLWLTIKESLDDTDQDAALQFQYLVPDDANTQQGIVTFTVPAMDTKDLLSGPYYIDIQAKDLLNDIYTVSEGRVTVQERVTKAQAADETPPDLYLPDPITIEYPYGNAGLAHDDPTLVTWINSALALDLNDGALSVTNDLFAKANPLPGGAHTIAFSAQDAAGNTTTLTRAVTVAEAASVNTSPITNDVQISIPETMNPGEVIGQVSAIDPENDSLTFAITEGNTNNDFTINASTGELSLANRVDYETLNSYVLIISVSDSEFTVNSTVTVNVLAAATVVMVEQFTHTNFEVV